MDASLRSPRPASCPRVERRERPEQQAPVVAQRVAGPRSSRDHPGLAQLPEPPAVGLSDEQIVATAIGDAGDPAWSERDALLVRLADELDETATVSDGLWDLLAAQWSPSQLLALVVLAGWHRLLAGVIGAARVQPESWARPRP